PARAHHRGRQQRTEQREGKPEHAFLYHDFSCPTTSGGASDIEFNGAFLWCLLVVPSCPTERSAVSINCVNQRAISHGLSHTWRAGQNPRPMRTAQGGP